jgi:hypothetical protein
VSPSPLLSLLLPIWILVGSLGARPSADDSIAQRTDRR